MMVFVLTALTVAMATVLQGITGFGFGLLAAPILLVLVTKTTSVTTLITIGTGVNAYLLWHLRGKAVIDTRLFKRLLISTAAGLPFGLLALKEIDIHALRVVAGVCVVLFAAIVYMLKVRIARTGTATAAAGWVAGVLQASIGLIGPPVALLLTAQEMERDEFRRTLAALFLIVNVITLSLFSVTGALSVHGVLLGLPCIPGALLGARAGSAVAHRVSEEQFTHLIFGLISVAGIIAVYTGITS